MTAQATVRTLLVPVQIPVQAGPAEPPAAVAPVATLGPLVGRERPLTTEERACALGLAVMCAVLGTIIVVGLLVAELVWT